MLQHSLPLVIGPGMQVVEQSNQVEQTSQGDEVEVRDVREVSACVRCVGGGVGRWESGKP